MLCGPNPTELSPQHHVGRDTPPTLIFHGLADTTTKPEQAENFRDAMNHHGNHCELQLYEGQSHGFFNYHKGDNPYFGKTRDAMIAFLGARNLLG